MVGEAAGSEIGSVPLRPLLIALVLAATAPAFARAQPPPLFYEVDGSGPAVVFLADWAQDTSIWFRVLPLLRRDYRLVRYDLRGQGRSEAPGDGDYSIVAHREDLLRILEGLGIRRAHLVGSGLGGAVALSFAAEHPERAISVTAIHPHLVWSPEDRGFWDRFLSAYGRAGRPPIADYASVLIDRWFGARYADQEPWVVAFSDLMLRRQASEALVASLQAWRGTELVVEGSVAVPVLLVWGERVGPPAGESRLHRSFRVARRLAVEGAGPVPQIEAPASLGEALAGFLRDVDPAGGGTR